MNAPESKEWFQQERQLSRRFFQFITNHDLVLVRDKHDTFRKFHFSYLVIDDRDRICLEINNILMAARLIDVTVAMNAQVELLSVHDQTFIH